MQRLEDEGWITGVFDDRGKFIFITEAELARVAAFVTERGRVSVAELAAQSNILIQLKATEAEGESEEATKEG